MNKLYWILLKLLSLPFNLKCLPFKQAIKVPIIIDPFSYVSIKNKKTITIKGSIRSGMIKLFIEKGSFAMGGVSL